MKSVILYPRVLIVLLTLALTQFACAFGGQAATAPTQSVPTEASQSTQTAPTVAGPTGGSPLDTLDPCAVVTQDDAKAFFGAPSAPGLPSKGAPVAFCVYSTVDNIEHLSLNLRYDDKGALSNDDYVKLKSLNQNVTGLGDGAFFDTGAHILTIAKGPWIVKLSGNLQGADSLLAKLTMVAPTVLGRLP